MKITNYEIYKLKKSGLTNQQILNVLEYGENVDQELLLGDIADISGCRNPAVFMERVPKMCPSFISLKYQITYSMIYLYCLAPRSSYLSSQIQAIIGQDGQQDSRILSGVMTFIMP